MCACADGSTYVGFWRRGQQHGEGVYKPSGPPRAEAVFIQAYQSGTLLQQEVVMLCVVCVLCSVLC